MRVESIRIFAKELQLERPINELIYALRHIGGEFAYTAKGKQKHFEIYTPEAARLRKIISKRFKIVLPEYAEYRWNIGKIGDGECFLKVFNPDWD